MTQPNGPRRSGGSTANPFAPRSETPRAERRDPIFVVVKGVRFELQSDGSVTAPNGAKLPEGTKIKTQARSGRRVGVKLELPGSMKLEIRDGGVLVRRDPNKQGVYPRNRKPDVVTTVVPPTPKRPAPTKAGVSPRGAQVDPRPAAPVVRGPVARPGETNAPAAPRPAPRKSTPTTTAPTAPAAPAAPRGAQVDPRIPATPATPRPATPATPGRPAAPAAPVRAGAAPAAPRAGVPAAPAVGAPTTRPAAPVASGSPNAPATAARPSAAVDAQVRQMFGEVAAFLTDPELGPLLRKAATEGWDSSRLMGALQQTKFWKTKGDAERKWIILNKLDNATAKTQVQSQMQAITDLARNEGVTLSGLQVHDLAVNVLKFGWSGSQVRENIFKAVPAAGLTTAVTQKYGYLASFMSNPEVGPLLQRGAREGWDAARLEAELQGTNFWKTTTDSQRRFNAQQTQDPGSAQQAIAQRTSQLQTTANGLGIRMDPARLGQIAKDSLAFGWDDSQVRQALAAEYDYQGSEFGFAGQTARQLKQIAADYLVPMSPQAMEKWTEDVVSGRIDEEGFRSYAVEQAKSQFPSLGAALDRGVTVAQYADPYKQIAARELELNPEQIDLNDPKWRAMLDTKDAKGQRVAMTLSEAQEYLRKRPEWQQTRGANERAASLTENLLRTFGATA